MLKGLIKIQFHTNSGRFFLRTVDGVIINFENPTKLRSDHLQNVTSPKLHWEVIYLDPNNIDRELFKSRSKTLPPQGEMEDTPSYNPRTIPKELALHLLRLAMNVIVAIWEITHHESS